MNLTSKESKKINLKISKIIILIGLLIIMLGGTFLFKSIASWNAVNKQYDAEKYEYDQLLNEWRDKWMNGEADLSDCPERPEKSSDYIKYPLLSFGSVVIVIVGLSVFISGLSPYTTKLFLKRKKETLDYIGNEITDIGTKAVDIGKPIHDKIVDEIVIPTANKKIDKVIVPAVKKVKNAIFDNEENSDNKTMYCRHCGKEIISDSKFCNHCGKEQ